MDSADNFVLQHVSLQVGFLAEGALAVVTLKPGLFL